MKSDADTDANMEKLERKENPPWRDESMDDFNVAFHQSGHSRFKNQSSVLLKSSSLDNTEGGWVGGCVWVHVK